jgi:Fanconi-associated nuclease 1
MIFALLFWDIIFADVPGAFETPYQTAPLDLAEETFYYARKEMIETRLKEVQEGQARAILERHDDAYREKNTWCVGVQWDICGKQDLVEIVEVSIPSSCSN